MFCLVCLRVAKLSTECCLAPCCLIVQFSAVGVLVLVSNVDKAQTDRDAALSFRHNDALSNMKTILRMLQQGVS